MIWMKVEMILWREMRQEQKDKHGVISFAWEVEHGQEFSREGQTPCHLIHMGNGAWSRVKCW